MSETKITLDATTPQILLESTTTGGTYGEDGSKSSTIKLNASEGVVEARNDNGVAQVSASGVFCNNAGTQAVAASLGIERKAAIVGLGYGSLAKETWNNENFIAGVYGIASNNSTAPAYGGYFQNLLVAGMLLNTKSIDNNTGTLNLSEYYSGVLGLCSTQKTIYLPNDGVIGRMIFVKMIGTGSLRFYPRSGQYLYDDDSANDYYEIGCGQMAVLWFTRFYVNSVVRDAWTISRFSF